MVIFVDNAHSRDFKLGGAFIMQNTIFKFLVDFYLAFALEFPMLVRTFRLLI